MCGTGNELLIQAHPAEGPYRRTLCRGRHRERRRRSAL